MRMGSIHLVLATSRVTYLRTTLARNHEQNMGILPE